MRAVVFDLPSLFRLSQCEIKADWFKEYGLPSDKIGIKRVVLDNIVYLLDNKLEDDDCPIVVVNVYEDSNVLPADQRAGYIFDRITTVARSLHFPSVSIPPNWHIHHDQSKLSIFCGNKNVCGDMRVCLDSHPRSRKDLFAFAITDGASDLSQLDYPLDIYDAARRRLPDAILTPANVGTIEKSRAGIVLSQRLPQGFTQGATLNEWVASKLTEEQREFINKPYDGPIRLRGSAGTGKTISLVIKFLRDGLEFETAKRKVRLGFLTHSLASVDLVGAISESLDRSGLLFGNGKFCALEVRTLYDLAHHHLHFELDQLRPLSLDGREGRMFQFELIGSTIKEMGASPIMKAQFSDLSPDIKTRWLQAAAGNDARFVTEIMNEFASVLDAEGIRAGEERGDRYAKGVGYRPVWLMSLPTEPDRRFILEIHRRYRTTLGEMKTLSVDQMVADFSSFLDSNRWDRIRHEQGYDALFVDELHLFTSIERQTLHKLIKRSTDDKGVPSRPPIFMAYDLKQSPRDTFAHYGGDGDANLFSSTTGLQNSELIKLSKVFRYTPQIAEFLADLDATFPAIDIPGEWNAYSGEAMLEDGSVPELTVFKDDETLFKRVFDEAGREARRMGGRRVAVLCPSEASFDRYLKAATGQYEGQILPISNREPTSELRYAGKRYIFSMPEYVAGLQFDTVYLIHVDSEEAPANLSIGARRQFISSVYLGASRAENHLKIFSSASRGGASDILNFAIERKTLRQVAPK